MMLGANRKKDFWASIPEQSSLEPERSPFSTPVTEADFYADAQRCKYLGKWQHLVNSSEKLLLITGEPGIGKTTLLERFIELANEHWRVCRLDGGVLLEASAPVTRIAQCFKWQIELRAENLIGELQRQLARVQGQQLPVLIVDNAEAMSVDALETVMHLASLKGEGGRLIRVVLSGTAELDQQLASRQSEEMAAPHRMELTPMDEVDSSAYLGHRLQAAGYQELSAFTGKELKRIYRDGKGIPALLNKAADNLLRERAAQQKYKIGSRQFIKYGLAASVVLGALIGLDDKINSLLGGEPQTTTVAAPEGPSATPANDSKPKADGTGDGGSIQVNGGAQEEATPGGGEIMTAEADISVQTPASKPAMTDTVPAAAPDPAQLPSQVAVTGADETTHVVNSDAVRQPESVADSAKADSSALNQSAKQEMREPERSAKAASTPISFKGYEWYQRQPQNNFTLQLMVGSHRDEVEAFTYREQLSPPLGVFVMQSQGKTLYALTKGSYANRDKAEQAAKGLPQGVKPWIRSMSSVKQVMLKPAQASSAVSVDSSGSEVKDTAWVWSQDPNHFSVQLSAAGNEQALEDGIRQIALQGELAVVKTERDGKPWYLLIYGSFASKEAALGAIQSLPQGLKQAGPWARSFANLQDEISRSTPAQ